MGMIANLVKFYEGGVQYHLAKKMDIAELIDLNRHAARIIRETKDK